jgi:DNA-binding MarR family transcriptional regulator
LGSASVFGVATEREPELDEAQREAHTQRLHHLIWEAYAHMEMLGDDAFTGTGLSNALTGTLNLIGAWPGATVSGLARNTPKSQQAISQIVARLEKLGYVERRVGPGRGVALHLTPAGEDARARGEAAELEMERRLREIVGSDLYEQLTGRLDDAVRRLGAERETRRVEG